MKTSDPDPAASPHSDGSDVVTEHRSMPAPSTGSVGTGSVDSGSVGDRFVMVALVSALALVVLASVVGCILAAGGVNIFLGAPPVFARFWVHVGPGTPVAIGFAIGGALLARRGMARLRWARLLPLAYLGSLLWTFSLAFVDLDLRALGEPLADPTEYLFELPRITDVHFFLSTFTQHILDFQPGRWTVHVSSHPPLATLFFWALERIGLGGSNWAGVAVIVIGCTVVLSVPLTLRASGAAGAARASVPLLVFFPGAVWVGVSADGMFAGVLAAGVAAAAWGSTRRTARRAIPISLLGGLLLGATLYLSYGLAVGVVLVAAVCWCSLRVVRRRGGSLRQWALCWAAVVAGVAVVAGWFFAQGFHWFRALALLQTRYYQGVASDRPYAYFIWANLAALTISAGAAIAPAVAVSIRSLRHSVRRPTATATATASSTRLPRRLQVPAVLTIAAACSVALADISGLSKAETERIWLPFGVWLLVGVTLLPRAWRWRLLVIQMSTALLVNHLLLTGW